MKTLKLINIVSQKSVYIADFIGGKMGEKRNITANFYNVVVNVFKGNDVIIIQPGGKRFRVEIIELEPLPKDRIGIPKNIPGGSF